MCFEEMSECSAIPGMFELCEIFVSISDLTIGGHYLKYLFFPGVRTCREVELRAMESWRFHKDDKEKNQ